MLYPAELRGPCAARLAQAPGRAKPSRQPCYLPLMVADGAAAGGRGAGPGRARAGGRAAGGAEPSADPCHAALPAKRLSVAEVIDGDTLRLADGRMVHVAGIEAVKAGPGDDVATSLAEAARARIGTAGRRRQGHVVSAAGGRTATAGVHAALTLPPGHPWRKRCSPGASPACGCSRAKSHAFPAFLPPSSAARAAGRGLVGDARIRRPARQRSFAWRAKRLI